MTDLLSRVRLSRGRPGAAVLATLALLLAPALAACTSSTVAGTPATPTVATTGGGTSGGSSGGSAPSPTSGGSGGPSATASTTVSVSVYYLHGETLAPARRTVAAPGTAAGAVTALLAGPTSSEAHAGWTSTIPTGTSLRGVSLHGTVATVDLSSRYAAGGGSFSMNARLAQVVFTATQFPAVRQVQFRLDGKAVTVFGGEGIVLSHPVGRADFESYAPAVLVEAPVIGDTVRSGFRVWGSANVFEAVFRLALTDSAGRTVADVRVMASSGTGTRGTFDVTLPYRSTAVTGPGSLTAYYLSAKDGSRITAAVIPVVVTRTG